MDVVPSQQVEFGGVGGSERVRGELMRLQPVSPGFNEPQNSGNVKVFVYGGIFLEVGLGEFEQGGRGAQAVFLQVDERARQLNQPFIKQPIWLSPSREPKLFEHVVRFEVQALVETFKKGQILGREFATP